jgi:tRNA-binding EMAP/Myf-like protein
MGIESNGMILLAENDKGELAFVAPAKNGINNGSTVK